MLFRTLMGYYFYPLKHLSLLANVIFLTRLEELNLVRFVGVKTEVWPPKPEASYSFPGKQSPDWAQSSLLT